MPGPVLVDYSSDDTDPDSDIDFDELAEKIESFAFPLFAIVHDYNGPQCCMVSIFATVDSAVERLREMAACDGVAIDPDATSYGHYLVMRYTVNAHYGFQQYQEDTDQFIGTEETVVQHPMVVVRRRLNEDAPHSETEYVDYTRNSFAH